MTGPSPSAQTPAVGLASIPVQPDRTVHCRGCGATTTAASARVTGAWSAVGDRAVWHCDSCTRALLPEFEVGWR